MNEAVSAVYCEQASRMEGVVHVIFALLKIVPSRQELNFNVSPELLDIFFVIVRKTPVNTFYPDIISPFKTVIVCYFL